MRILIVDNHDSFTQNLAHLLADVTGHVPEVVANDAADLTAAHLARVDLAVVSPGPGRPDRPADVGHSARVITETDLPVLGVCLGHQLLAHLEGGTVAHAPAPRHGRTSAVHHHGAGPFAGLPSPLTMVRYHSLAVTALPPSLEALATSDDGVLMALAHRHRPRWGVQFHPESIGSEHGAALLAGVIRLAGGGVPLRRRGPPRTSTPRPDPAGSASSVGSAGPAGSAGLAGSADTDGPARPADPAGPRVEVRELAEVPDAERAFGALFAGSHAAFWLDSSAADPALGAEAGEHGGRFSVMGDATGPRAAVATADVTRGTVTVRDAHGVRVHRRPFFAWLDDDLRARRVTVPPLPCPFALGWGGYLGYELKAECGGTRAHRAPTPDAGLVFADRALVVDHRDRRAWLLALVEGDEQAGAWFDTVAATLRAAPELALTQPPAPSPVTLRHDREAYLGRVARCQELIVDGETYEVCLTNQARARTRLDPWASYRRLRRLSPAPYGAYLRLGGLSVLSTSPERFLRVDADRSVTAQPIKGTRPRASDPDADRLLSDELAASEKDRAENLMVVDMVRHDLGRTAAPGTVRVDPLCAVETHARAHQLVSTVRARLAENVGVVECVRAAFPGGSMTGAPKERTMALIDALEGGPRGIYSGALGYFSLSGAVDLGMVIRTLVVDGDEVGFGVGGAVIALSDPAAEYEETAVKASALLALLGAEFPERAPSRRSA